MDQSRQRIALVANEILGATNGGIGPATSYLGIALAQQGHEVEIVYFGRPAHVDEAWSRRYVEYAISITQLPGRRRGSIEPSFLSTSFALYELLKQRSHDVIVFQDWQGPGFCSIRAKQVGLAFPETKMVVYCHGGGDWVAHANRRFLHTQHEIGTSIAERASIEGADCLVSPSRYMLDWMESKGWRLPEHRVIPYFSASTAEPEAFTDGRRPTDEGPIEELVFFGRLEERKGVGVFVEGLNRLGPQLLARRQLTFLGSAQDWSTKRVERTLHREVRDSVKRIVFETNLDQTEALSRLALPGRLAVMPSLVDNSPCVIYECLERGIPFIASDAGGGRELIDEKDRGCTLFQPTPDGLAATLEPLLKTNTIRPPARPSFDGEAIHAAWEAVVSARPAPRTMVRQRPFVSVVVTHYERPELVRHCLEGLRRQTYDNFEVILVDDGSASTKAADTLKQLEADQSWPWPFRVVRQQNRYVGAARNTGWRAAGGTHVVFLDDDNVPTDDLLGVLVDSQAAAGADVVTCGVRMFYGDHGAPPPAEEDLVWLFIGEARELGVLENQYGDATAIWKRTWLERLGGFHERHGVTYEDWQLLARASQAGAIITSVPEPLLWYRITKRSMFRSRNESDCREVLLDAFRPSMPHGLDRLPDLFYAAHARADSYTGLPRGFERLAAYLRHARILKRRTVDTLRDEGFTEFVRSTAAYTYRTKRRRRS